MTNAEKGTGELSCGSGAARQAATRVEWPAVSASMHMYRGKAALLIGVPRTTGVLTFVSKKGTRSAHSKCE